MLSPLLLLGCCCGGKDMWRGKGKRSTDTFRLQTVPGFYPTLITSFCEKLTLRGAWGLWPSFSQLPHLQWIISNISLGANIFQFSFFHWGNLCSLLKFSTKSIKTELPPKYGSSGTEKDFTGYPLGLPSGLYPNTLLYMLFTSAKQHWAPGSELSGCLNPVISFNPEWPPASPHVLPSLQWQVQIHLNL